MMIFFDEFAGIALKLETGGPMFSSFNSLTSLPSVAKEDWKLIGKKFKLLKKKANSTTQPRL